MGLTRCLQLAPEKVTHDYLTDAFGMGYFTADLNPERYEHAKCLKLKLPEDFQIFPNEYFDLIIHNHVLEHIPGNYKSHIIEFYRILKTGGIMAFTIPDYHMTKGLKETREGGELLASDSDRVREFGQGDHYKMFGTDLISFLESRFSQFKPFFMKNDDFSKNPRMEHNACGIVFWCVK